MNFSLSQEKIQTLCWLLHEIIIKLFVFLEKIERIQVNYRGRAAEEV